MASVPQFDYVSTALHDNSVAVIKYNRPEVGNAVNYHVQKVRELSLFLILLLVVQYK